MLARTLGARAVVEKRRALYRYGDTRIHLDLVTGLGEFVELETVVANDGQTPAERTRIEAAATVEHGEVIALLGLDGLPPIAGSYCDLLAEKGSTER